MTEARSTAEQARDRAVEALAEADTLDGVERHAAEQQALLDFADGMAEALDQGMYGSETGGYAAMLAEEANYYNKTDIQSLIQERAESRNDSKKINLEEYVQDRLDEVVIVRTTDQKQGATYRWHFDNCKVETRSGKDGRGHFEWSNFRNYILEAGGADVGRPTPHLRDGAEWREFMVEVIDEYGRTVTTEGPRTTTLRKLQNRIETSMGYGDVEAAAARDDLYLKLPKVDIPEWWAGFGRDRGERQPPDTVQEVWVPNHMVTNLCETTEITPRALQVELDARGYTLPRLNGGVSETQMIHGQRYAWWVLSPDVALPNAYAPEAVNPADSIESQINTEPQSQSVAADGDGLSDVGDIQ